MEYNYDVNALILVTTSVNEENSEANFLAKRFTCWSHCVTIRLTNKSKGSEVGDPNLRFIDGTCGYEEWSLKLKEEVKDQLISGFRLSFKVPKDSREYLLKKDNISVGFLGSIDDRMWIDEAMLILNSPNFSPCPFVLEEVKHVQVYADMMIIFVPIYLRNGSHLHRIITENKKSTIIPVLKRGTAPLDVFASLETITYERHTWFDYIKEALYQRILYICEMAQSGRSVLLIGSIKDFSFIESAVFRLQLSSYIIYKKKLTKTLGHIRWGRQSANVLFLSRITKDFKLSYYELMETKLITILTERTQIPVALESTTRLEAFSGENQWLERLLNLLKEKEVKEKQTLPILGRKTEESSTHSTDAQVLGRRREELSTPFTDIYGDQSSKEKFKPEDFTKNIDLYLEKEKMSHPEMKFVTKGDQSLDDEDKLEETIFYTW